MEPGFDFAVSRTPLNRFGAAFRPGHSLLMAPQYVMLEFPQPDVAEVRATRRLKITVTALSAMGLAGVGFAAVGYMAGVFGGSIAAPAIIGVLGLLLALGGVYGAVTDARRVWTFDRHAGTLQITPRMKGVGREIPLAEIAAVQLVVADTATAVYETNLVLRQPAGKRLTVMCHRDPAMRSDADKLAAFLQVPMLDHAKEPSVIAGREVQVERTLLDSTISSGRSMELVSSGTRRMVLKPTRGSCVFRAGFISFGVFGLGMGTLFVVIALRESDWAALAGSAIGFVVGAAFLFFARWTRDWPIVFDGFRRAVRSKEIERNKELAGEIPFRTIAALQICAGMIYPPDDDPPFMAFQLNLVLTEPPDRRLVLFTQGDEQSLRQVADQLASFLGVPLLDHTPQPSD